MEKREAKLEKEEAEKYSQLKKDIEAKNVQLYLCQLYHNERAIEQIEKEMATKRDAISEIRQRRTEAEAKVHERQTDVKRAQRDCVKYDQRIQQKVGISSEK